MHGRLSCQTTFGRWAWVHLAKMQMWCANREPGADHRSYLRPGSHLRSPEHGVQPTRRAYTTLGSPSRHIRTQRLPVPYSPRTIVLMVNTVMSIPSDLLSTIYIYI